MFDFLFNSSKSVERDLSFIGVDMHSHLLPGLDDGAVTLEESLHYFKLMKKWGYRKCIVTPHIFQGVYNNSPETILPVFKSIQAALVNAGCDIQVEVAAEYMVDESFIDTVLNQPKHLLSFGNKFVLIEMPFAAASPYIETAIFNLVLNGFTPIIAHPERYSYYFQQPQYYHRLIEMGCLFQINMLSLSGYYGKSVKKMAINLIDQQLVSFIGTDMHHLSHCEAIKAFTKTKEFYKLSKRIDLKNNTL